MKKHLERFSVDEQKRTTKPMKAGGNKDIRRARATLDLLATGLATRTGCIHLVAKNGTAAMFDPFQGGRAEFATMLLRDYLALPDDADVRAAVSDSRDEVASSEDTALTLWEVPLFELGLLAMTPRCAGTRKPPVGLTVTNGPDSETPAYEFACCVLDRYFGEGAV